MSEETNATWSESNSQLYQAIASIAVPARAEQLATLLTLLPFAPDDSFRVVELGAGEGFLAAALLTCYPAATVLALDGSAEMRRHSTRRLQPFAERGEVATFDLMQTAWHTRLDNADVVLSSLCVHHLSGEQKRALFGVIGRRLSAQGALFIADLVAPQRPEAAALFAGSWDQAAQRQSRAVVGDASLFDKFEQAQWNLYRYPDPVDKPSPLFEQLVWLREAGFAVVDCFWMQAGHAIYGGYKNNAPSPRQMRLAYAAAFKSARQILQE